MVLENGGMRGCELRELATTALMLPVIGGGVKACVTHRVLGLRRHRRLVGRGSRPV